MNVKNRSESQLGLSGLFHLEFKIPRFLSLLGAVSATFCPVSSETPPVGGAGRGDAGLCQAPVSKAAALIVMEAKAPPLQRSGAGRGAVLPAS